MTLGIPTTLGRLPSPAIAGQHRPVLAAVLQEARKSAKSPIDVAS
jgi:hypothetical protein